METRKRQIPEDGEATLSKKRALIDAHGSPTPHVNGLPADGDEPKDDNLELFRKEAIFRRMKHYSREYERSQGRIEELERLRRTFEAGLAALEACWTQLLDTARSLVNPEDAPTVDGHTRDLFDLSTAVSSSESELSAALQGKVRATAEVLTLLVRGGAPTSVLRDSLFQNCQRAQTEATGLRSEVTVLNARLRDAQSEKDRYLDDLVRAQKRIDRLKSETLRATHGIVSPKPEVDSKDLKVEPAEEQKSQPSSSSPPPLQPPVNGAPDPASNMHEFIAASRLKHITQLQTDLSQCRLALHAREAELKSPPTEAIVLESAQYKALNEHFVRLQTTAEIQKEELQAAQNELAQLKDARRKFEDDYVADNSKALQELKMMVAKRDNENARLRDTRDQQSAELTERKNKDDRKAAALDECKKLAEARAHRIGVLQSEVTRLKTRLAANAGDADLMAFFAGDQEANGSYVSDLRGRLEAAENRATALQASLSTIQANDPDVARLAGAEADARRQLADATKKLEKYQATFGGFSKLPPDTASLAEQLHLKEEALHKLRLQVSQHVQSETALFAELDKLSAAWEALDRQVNSKVFDLSVMEERVAKSGVEKAKSENKFFAAMRDKEAVETERKNLARNLEKQAKAVERLMVSEKSLSAQVADLEKEVGLMKKAETAYREQEDRLNSELISWKHRSGNAETRGKQLWEQMKEHEQLLQKRHSDLRQKEEEHITSQKELERRAAKLKLVPPPVSAPGSSKEVQLQGELEKCMSILKCSTCGLRMRNTVITKCMHSFCKDCVDARISTRQRKCPACSIAFAQSEVQHLYFQ